MQSMAEQNVSSLFFSADVKKYFPSFPACCDTGNWHPQGESQADSSRLSTSTSMLPRLHERQTLKRRFNIIMQISPSSALTVAVDFNCAFS